MLGIENFPIFLTAGILLNLAPGSDTIYILSRTMSQGKKAGVMSVFGIITGALAHTLFAAIGLSMILMQSAIVFHIIKWLGAGYLIYLGIQAIRSKNAERVPIKPQREMEFRKIYVQGILTCLLNPKVALFYLSFLPQFISTDNPFGPLPFILLGLAFITTATIWCLILVHLSARLAVRLKSDRLARYAGKITGIIYIALGLNVLRASR